MCCVHVFQMRGPFVGLNVRMRAIVIPKETVNVNQDILDNNASKVSHSIYQCIVLYVLRLNERVCSKKYPRNNARTDLINSPTYWKYLSLKHVMQTKCRYQIYILPRTHIRNTYRQVFKEFQHLHWCSPIVFALWYINFLHRI